MTTHLKSLKVKNLYVWALVTDYKTYYNIYPVTTELIQILNQDGTEFLGNTELNLCSARLKKKQF